jgi:hypothetical protein
MRMACYGGKLYVACMGGFQGPDCWGDIWEVDMAAMTARRVLDGHDIPYNLGGGQTAAVGMYGIQCWNSGGELHELLRLFLGDIIRRGRRDPVVYDWKGFGGAKERRELDPNVLPCRVR